MNASHFWSNASPPCCTIQQYSTETQTNTPCNRCGGFMISGRRGGIAGRGQGSSQSITTTTTTTPSTKRARYEAPPPPTYQANVIHEEQDEDCDTDREYYCLSPPLSPKSTVLPRKRASQREDSKRNHAPLKRKPSWKPSLKQEFARRGSIDAVMANSDDERVWRKVCGDMATTTQESGVVGTGTGSGAAVQDVVAVGGAAANSRQRRRQSTLLHPSTPADERADPLALYAAPGVKVVDTRPAAVEAPSIVPSPPSSYSSPFFPPPAPAPAPITSTTTTTTTTPSQRPQRPTLGPRKGSSLLHPSPPPSEASINSAAQLKTVISIPPMKKSEMEWWDNRSTAVVVPPTRANTAIAVEDADRGAGVATTPPQSPFIQPFPRHGRGLALERDGDECGDEDEEAARGGVTHHTTVHNPRLRNILAGYMRSEERQREGSVMHSCLSDDDDDQGTAVAGQECLGGGDEGGRVETRRQEDRLEKKGDLIIMLKELRTT